MQALEQARYLALREGATVLEADGTGDKVLRLADGSMLKLFRRKRLLSSAAWYPYAQRFADNCRHLQERQIPCPVVKAVYRIGAIERDAVHYAPLPGQTLRQVLEQPADHDQLRAQLGRFIAILHERGVYFRSAHMGNVVLTPEGELGLIDIADLRIFRRPLRKSQRLRNFKHMLRYPQDRQWLLDAGDSSFVDGYLAAQQLCSREELAKVLA
ncbi:toluene tolerance protein [Pseudomonas plecoglossicida]|uniref:toluene tolerance protein n=1 Tax=Pseudomonas plecoglossicida TaxID=70775 RepID=UPI0015E45D2B|nr:toluene tolerance protein [Pseudomonas plecoglossicida]MBA1199314.1 toluene tolerance protein [Pseudomonas plecoglossicida]